MKTTAKKTLSVLLSLLMVLSVCVGMAFTANAASSGTCGDGLTWTLDDDGLLTIRGTGEIDEAAFEDNEDIKAVVIGSGVTGIGTDAFKDCVKLVSVDIPDSVTGISAYAFQGCSSLTYVEIPDSVTSISAYAFQGCSSLTSLDIPDGVTSIVSFTFQGCSSLTSLNIPAGVTSLGAYAFDGCSGLTSAVIPSGETSVPAYCFNGCGGLTSVVIPSGITTVGAFAFNRCGRLTDVYYAGSETQWSGISILYGNGNLTGAAIHYNCTVTGTTPATCTEQGSIAVTSGGESFTITTPAKGHNWVWAIDTPAYCIYNGKKHEKCTRCGETRNENTVIPATGIHTYGTTGDTRFTCVVCGLINDDRRDEAELADADWRQITVTDDTSTLANGDYYMLYEDLFNRLLSWYRDHGITSVDRDDPNNPGAIYSVPVEQIAAEELDVIKDFYSVNVNAGAYSHYRYKRTCPIPTGNGEEFFYYTAYMPLDMYDDGYVTVAWLDANVHLWHPEHVYGDTGDARFTCTICGEADNDLKAAAALADAKADAKAKLENYVAAIDRTDYRPAQQTELANAIAAGNDAIDAAATVAEVVIVLEGAKAAIDKIKTDAQLTAEEAAALAAAKAAAKDELASYKNPDDYRDAQKNDLAAAITAGNEAIDSAATITEVEAALAEAKAVIDAIKTDAEITAEEAAAAEAQNAEAADEGPGVCEYCGETHNVNTITGFFTDMLHDMLYIVMRLARFFCYEIFVS